MEALRKSMAPAAYGDAGYDNRHGVTRPATYAADIVCLITTIYESIMHHVDIVMQAPGSNWRQSVEISSCRPIDMATGIYRHYWRLKHLSARRISFFVHGAAAWPCVATKRRLSVG